MASSDKDQRKQAPAGAAGAEKTLLAETEEDWQHAIDEWDHSLHLSADEDLIPTDAPLRPGARAGLKEPASAAGAPGAADDEAEALPPLPEEGAALPDFKVVPSVPPTLVADLQSMLQLAQPDGLPTAEGAEPELPEAPLPPPSSASALRRRSALSPAPSRTSQAPPEPEDTALPLPPPPTPVPEPAGLADLGEAPADGPPPAPQPKADAAEESWPRHAFAATGPRLPTDEEFYDTIAIEQPEPSLRGTALPPSAQVTRIEVPETTVPETTAPEPARAAPPPQAMPTDGEPTPQPGELTAAELPATITMEAELPPGSALSPEGSGPEPQPEAAALAVPHAPIEAAPAAPAELEPPSAVSRRSAPPSGRSPVPLSVLAPLSRSSLTPAPRPRGAPELFPRRLPRPQATLSAADPMPALAAAPAGPLSGFARRSMLQLLDEEIAQGRGAAGTEPARTARLQLFAARQAEALREPADALDRYRSALEESPDCRPALRGLRRLLSQPGPAAQPEEALTFLDQELERAAAGERAFLWLQRGELLLALGQPAPARESFERALQGQPAPATATAAVLGLVSVAARGTPAEQVAALERLLPLVPERSSLRSALQLERARLGESLGQDAEAIAAYEAGLASGMPGAALPCGLGLLRTALRLPAEGEQKKGALTRARQALLDVLAPSALRTAIARWPAASPPTEAELRALAEAGNERPDRLLLEDLARLSERGDPPERAAQDFLRLAQAIQDPARRQAALTRAGEIFERAGQLAPAREALLRAQEIGAAEDVLLERALLRIDRSSGQHEALIAACRQQAQHHPDPAFFHTTAARLLLEVEEGGTGRDAAIAELQQAVARQPGYGPAVALLRDLLLQAGRPEEAARVLRAAAGTGPAGGTASGKVLPKLDAARRLHYLEDAARLLGRAGHAGEGARLLYAELPRLPQDSAQLALRWQLQRLLSGPGRVELTPEVDVDLATLLADLFGAEAEGSGDRQRAADLWYRRGLLLSALHPRVSDSGGPVEDSLQWALLLEPAHDPALLGLYERVLAEQPERSVRNSVVTRLLLTQLRERLLAATGRPEAVLLLLRLAALQEQQAEDPAGALGTLNLLRSLAPALPGADVVEETLLQLARRARDLGALRSLLEGELAREEDPDLRFALLLQIGELCELQEEPTLAAAHYEQALELKPSHPVVHDALARAYRDAGMFAELLRLARTEIREATDVATRVTGWERIAEVARLDPSRRDEPRHAIEAYRSILDVDANHHGAMRVLERHYIAEQNLGDLIYLYEQMGLTATDPAFAVHIHLDRARLRQRLAAQRPGAETEIENELENDFRLALFRDSHSRPALRHVLAAALRTHDLQQVADLSTRLADICDQAGAGRGEAGDGRAAAVFLTRAAECYVALGRPPEVVAQAYRTALDRNPRHLPAIRGFLYYALDQQAYADAADMAELLGAALHDQNEAYGAYLLAGAIAQERLGEASRALALYREAQRLDPQRTDAFDRLRVLLSGHGGAPADPVALGDLLTEQLLIEPEGPRRSALRIELAALLRDSLGNRARAKVELHQALGADPNHPEALALLSELHFEDGEWALAADLLLRRARVERRPVELAEVFLRLGQIYSEHLPDARRAVAAYARALELAPDHLAALSQLSALYLSQQRPEASVPLLRHMAELAQDRDQKVGYLHRIARLHEGLGEKRPALEALRQALEADPMYLPAIGELAQFFDRQSDVQSMRVHLDRSAARWRQLLRDRPDDPAVYQALLQIYLWRRANDQAVMTASALLILDSHKPLPPEALPLLERAIRSDGYPGAALREPGLDELLYPPSLPAGFRNLFALLEEPLGKVYRADARRLQALGIDKREKLPRSGHPVRDLANRIAADLGLGDFDIYLTAAQGRDAGGRPLPLCTLEAFDPPALVLSQALLFGAAEGELRFLLGRLLKLLQGHLVLPLRLPTDDLGVLVGGLVRLYVPDYVSIGIAEKLIVAEAQRLQKLIPRKLQAQLLPFVLECSSTALDLATVPETLSLCGNHAGLLCCGSLASAHAALRRFGAAAEPQLKELLRFAVGDEFAEMRRLVGTSLDVGASFKK